MSKYTNISFTGSERHAALVMPARLGEPCTAPYTGTYYIDGEARHLEAGEIVTPIGELERLREVENIAKWDKKKITDLCNYSQHLADQLSAREKQIAQLQDKVAELKLDLELLKDKAWRYENLCK